MMFTKVEIQGDYTIVHVSGRLDIDKTALFKNACLSSLKNKNVIFHLEKLSFVGSTGISNFFQVLMAVSEANNKNCRIVGLNNDFKRILGLFNIQMNDVSETVELAIASIERPYDFQKNNANHIDSLIDTEFVENTLEVEGHIVRDDQTLTSESTVLEMAPVVLDPERNS